MTIVRRLMAWLMPHRCNAPALDARIKDALAESDRATEAVQRIVESSEAEEADANELSGSVRERLAHLETRRARRAQDPRVTVVIETIRILEGRP